MQARDSTRCATSAAPLMANSIAVIPAPVTGTGSKVPSGAGGDTLLAHVDAATVHAQVDAGNPIGEDRGVDRGRMIANRLPGIAVLGIIHFTTAVKNGDDLRKPFRFGIRE